MSTDTGHISAAADGTWALNAPETIIDWGHRAMHGSVVLSKVGIPMMCYMSRSVLIQV